MIRGADRVARRRRTTDAWGMGRATRGPGSRTLVGSALIGFCVAGCSLLGDLTFDRATSGWSPKPTAVDPAFAEFARDACLTEPGFEPDRELQDQRGPDAAAFLWLDGEDDAGCFIHRDEDGILRASWLNMTDRDTRPDSLTIMVDRAGRGPFIASGSTGPGVSGVELVLPDGNVVAATVDGGTYLAWWPPVDDWVILRSLGPDGSVIEQIGPVDEPSEIVSPG